MRKAERGFVAVVALSAVGSLLLLATAPGAGVFDEAHSIPAPEAYKEAHKSFKERPAPDASIPPPRRTPPARSVPCAVLNQTFRVAPQCGGPEPERVFPLLITGTGRAGTKFTALALRAAGFVVAHDDSKVARDGAVSWALAIRETEMRASDEARGFALPGFAREPNPGLRGPAPRWRFRRVFHQVRHPLKVVLSRANRVGMMEAPIVYSNPYLFRNVLGHAPGFPPPDELEAWRRDRAARDEWSTDKRLRVALFHYVFWNDWVSAYADWTFRVEDLDIPLVAERAGLKASRAASRAPAAGANHHGLADDLANLTWPELRRVSPVVWDRATALARGYGYDV